LLLATPGSLEIEQGVNFEVVFELFDDDKQTQRTPLTGYHAILQARRRRGDTGLILDVSSIGAAPKLFIEDASDGPTGQWIRLHLDSADTTAIKENGDYALALVNDTDPDDIIAVCDDVLVLKKKLVGS
jgi:hypothetical protein